MSSETGIPNNIIRHRERIGSTDPVLVRRCRVRRGSGTADLLIFLNNGPHRTMIVEVNQINLPVATGKVLEQFLLYDTGLRQISQQGVGLIKQDALSKSMQSVELLIVK